MVDSSTEVSILTKKRNYDYELRAFIFCNYFNSVVDSEKPTEFGNKLRKNRFVFRLFLDAFYK